MKSTTSPVIARSIRLPIAPPSINEMAICSSWLCFCSSSLTICLSQKKRKIIYETNQKLEKKAYKTLKDEHENLKNVRDESKYYLSNYEEAKKQSIDFYKNSGRPPHIDEYKEIALSIIEKNIKK